MLDPRSVRPDQVTGTVSSGNLPKLSPAQAKFGYVPDRSSLRPGDLLLTRTLDFELTSAGISFTQRLQRNEHTDWTHAAIYADDWRVFEATPESNVASANIVNWMPNTAIMVRRPVKFDHLSKDDAMLAGMRLVMEAALMQGNATYGKTTAAMILLRVLKAFRNIPAPVQAEQKAGSIICSGLYAKCFNITTGEHLTPKEMLRSDEPVTPALLAGLDTLRPVDIGWCRIV